MKYLLCQVLVGVAAASTDHNKDIINLRKLQDATRPPKTPPPTPALTRPPKTPPPTPARTRPPKTPPPTPSPPTPTPTTAEAESIAQIVCSDDEFFKLCSYLELTGLDEILNSNGTYTLFAPNDAAFELLTILPELSDEEIKGMLMYHVAPSELTYKDLMSIAPGDVETMVPKLPIGVSTGFDDEVLLNGNTKIIEPDIEASNGIIQVIDQVIMPQITRPSISPTPVPSTAKPTLNSTEVITPDPTYKPTTAAPVAQVDTKTPTTSPTAQVDTMSPTLQPTSKAPTTGVITESPTEFPTPLPYYGKDTPEPTNYASIIEDFGSSSPTREKYGVFASKSRKSSGSSKSSKSKSSKSKSSKSYEVVGKAGKSSGSSKYYATLDVSMQKAFGEGEFSNARFRADLNASSLLRGGSCYYLSMVTLAAAWYWLN